jgi:hypothetical protein
MLRTSWPRLKSSPSETLSRMWSTLPFVLRRSTTPCLFQLLVSLLPPRVSPSPPQAGRHFSSFSRVCSPFAKATSNPWMSFMSAKKCFLRISETSTKRCRLSSPSSSSAPSRLIRSFWIRLPHSLLPRWSTSAWTSPALRAPTLGASAPLPLSLTPTKKVTAMATTRKRRTTSSSYYYSFIFPLFGVLMSKGENYLTYFLSLIRVSDL